MLKFNSKSSYTFDIVSRYNSFSALATACHTYGPFEMNGNKNSRVMWRWMESYGRGCCGRRRVVLPSRGRRMRWMWRRGWPVMRMKRRRGCRMGVRMEGRVEGRVRMMRRWRRLQQRECLLMISDLLLRHLAGGCRRCGCCCCQSQLSRQKIAARPFQDQGRLVVVLTPCLRHRWYERRAAMVDIVRSQRSRPLVFKGRLGDEYVTAITPRLPSIGMIDGVSWSVLFSTSTFLPEFE